MNTHNWAQPFEEYAQNLLIKSKTPGAIVALAKEGELVYYQTFGYSNVENKTAMKLDTVFGLASVTKSFACATIMHLQEQGKLSVHDPVVKYLPEFRTPDEEKTKKITIHHLMNHTSGLPVSSALTFALKRSMEADPDMHEPGQEDILKKHPPIDTHEELMAYIASRDFEMLGEPGTQYNYSNDAYGLLSAIINRASGKSFEGYLKENILDPAGMSNTVFYIEDLKDHTDITTLYSSRVSGSETEVFPAPLWWKQPAMLGSGALKSTVRDLLRYLEMYRTGGVVGTQRILSSASVEQMTTPFFQINLSQFYGYGLTITTEYHGATMIGHGGNTKGVSSHICLIPELGITGVVLTNIMGAPSAKLMFSVLNAIQGLPLDTPLVRYPEHDLPIVNADQYAGDYGTEEEGTRLSIKNENGKLLLVFGAISVPLRHIGDNIFVEENMQVMASFIRNNDGQIIRINCLSRQLTRIR
ncbi:serine hydrolase domain-containing protein [Brevibacillus fluminis]|nr:serine hydrolase domain-containing protein [Brevibacillus fluminis]